MDMERAESIKDVIIICLLILLTFGGFTIRDINKKNEFRKGPLCRTETTWIRRGSDADGQRVIRYKFIVGNKTYKGTVWYGSLDESGIKKTMVVEYVCNNPRNNKLELPEL